MIIGDEILEHVVDSFKKESKKIVLVGGCFDVLHEAHLEFLEKAKREGDTLILLLESDENIRRLKGEGRPKNDLKKRSDNLESLGFIDLIVQLSPNVSDKYYSTLTKLIRPDIIALTKNDPLTEKKEEQANKVGGKVKEVMQRNKKYSSTRLINEK